ncbi:MAG: SGNH/GDSL hydrolase family protein [Deltaproteobacteria bacterium]|nr:SGNH/GDSL hydrolase family protein [Deltaproteobacteria bacterium]
MIATRRWRAPRVPILVALVAFTVTCAAGARGGGDPIPRGDPRGIACIGDSSAAGIYATHSWCERIGGTNFAREGATPTEALAQLEALRSARPAFVVAQIGANGHGEPSHALAHLLAETEAAVERWGGKLIVIDYPLTIWPEMRWKRELRAAVPAGVALVDPALPWYRIAADHIHPTPLGHRDIAERLRPHLSRGPAAPTAVTR